MLSNSVYVSVDKCQTEMGCILAPKITFDIQFRNTLHTYKGPLQTFLEIP
jgi:hypothetical protein